MFNYSAYFIFFILIFPKFFDLFQIFSEPHATDVTSNVVTAVNITGCPVEAHSHS